MIFVDTRLRAFSFSDKVTDGRSSVFLKRAARTKCDLRVWDIPTCKRLAKVRQTDPACQVPKKAKRIILMFRTVNTTREAIINLEKSRIFLYNTEC